MGKGLLSTVVLALVATSPASAQTPSYLPGPGDPLPGRASVGVGMPVLLPAAPDSLPPATDTGLTGGSTGLRPGVDCLPNPCDVCPTKPRMYGDIAYLLLWFDR